MPRPRPTNADFKKVYDAMVAFRNDQYLWWQVAEYTFDSFMIRARTRSLIARSRCERPGCSAGPFCSLASPEQAYWSCGGPRSQRRQVDPAAGCSILIVVGSTVGLRLSSQ